MAKKFRGNIEDGFLDFIETNGANSYGFVNVTNKDRRVQKNSKVYIRYGAVVAIENNNYQTNIIERVLSLPNIDDRSRKLLRDQYIDDTGNLNLVESAMDLQMAPQAELMKIIKENFIDSFYDMWGWGLVTLEWVSNKEPSVPTVPAIQPSDLVSKAKMIEGKIVNDIAPLFGVEPDEILNLRPEIGSNENYEGLKPNDVAILSYASRGHTVGEIILGTGISLSGSQFALARLWINNYISLQTPDNYLIEFVKEEEEIASEEQHEAEDSYLDMEEEYVEEEEEVEVVEAEAIVFTEEPATGDIESYKEEPQYVEAEENLTYRHGTTEDLPTTEQESQEEEENRIRDIAPKLYTDPEEAEESAEDSENFANFFDDVPEEPKTAAQIFDEIQNADPAPSVEEPQVEITKRREPPRRLTFEEALKLSDEPDIDHIPEEVEEIAPRLQSVRTTSTGSRLSQITLQLKELLAEGAEALEESDEMIAEGEEEIRSLLQQREELDNKIAEAKQNQQEAIENRQILQEEYKTILQQIKGMEGSL